MSFSSEIKQELNKTSSLSDKEIVKNELIGYLISGNIEITEKNYLKFSTESDYNINRFSKLLDNLNINYNIEILGKNFIVTLKKKDILDFVLINENKIYLQNNYIEKLENENLKAIVRGVFMGSGSINDPNKKYHLEISFKEEENLNNIIDILKILDINTKKLTIKNKKSLYIKEGEEISKFLAFIGANNSVLKFEEIRVYRDIRNNVNRRVNCETANLNKTVNSALKQIEAIKYLQEKGKLEKLSEGLQEIAKLRIAHPEASLVELGAMLKKPIGKSGVNHRLKSIEKIANEQ